MQFLELAKKRYSCRHYTDQAVEQEKIEQILEAARVAPTGANRQPCKFIVVQKKESLEKLSKAMNVYSAPLAIIVCGDNDMVWTRTYDNKKITDIDASIVTTHMMLQACDIGLDSVWMCAFKQDIIKKEFFIPHNVDVVNVLLVGYGDETPKSSDRHDTARKPMEQLVCYEQY